MSSRDDRADQLIGQVIAGKYECTRLVGRGGMGSVYELRHVRLNRKFALKTLSAELLEDAQALGRFEREADVVAKLRHPNIVDIVDWDTLADGSPCIIMEYLEGEDLAARIRHEGALPWDTIIGIADPILSALCVAHSAGIVHRDLKPQNVFLAADDAGEERPKLLDFGVSKIRGSGTLATADASLIGTPAYMAPEQADGRPEDIGPATDCWAMGALLYEMASGRQAFGGSSVPRVLYQICFGSPAPLAPLRADAPPAFVSLLERAMSRDLGLRITNAEQLRAELREALADHASRVLSESLRRRTPVAFLAQDSNSAATDDTELAMAKPQTPTTLGTSVGESMGAASREERSARGRPIAALGAVAVLAGALALWQWPSGATPPAAEPAAVAASAVVANDAAVLVTDAEPATRPEPAATITVAIRANEGVAEVYREADGAHLGSTPFSESFARGNGELVFRIKREGYETKRLALAADQDHDELIELVATKKKRGRRTVTREPTRPISKPPVAETSTTTVAPGKPKRREPIAPPF